MIVTRCLPYINNEIRFCNLLNQANNKKQKHWLRQMLQEKEREQAAEDAMHKFCPHCFMQMSLTNICDLCGYKA